MQATKKRERKMTWTSKKTSTWVSDQRRRNVGHSRKELERAIEIVVGKDKLILAARKTALARSADISGRAIEFM